MLTTFVKKAEATTKKYWKWILGIVIAVLVAYVIWRIKRQQDEIEILRAEKELFEERAKDAKTAAANEKDEDMAAALRAKAEAYEAAAAEKDTKIKAVESRIKREKDEVKAAQDWKALEDAARGNG